MPKSSLSLKNQNKLILFLNNSLNKKRNIDIVADEIYHLNIYKNLPKKNKMYIQGVIDSKEEKESI
jgi:hypothetical protein